MDKSKSEILLEDILLKLKSVNKFDFNPDVKKANRLGKLLKQEVENLIMQLYHSSKQDDFYYLDCPLVVYKNTYKSRLEQFFEEDQEEYETIFLKKELEDLMNPFYAGYKIKLDKFRFYCQNKIYNTSFNSKIEFIRNKLFLLGYLVNISPEVNSIPKYFEFSRQNISIKYTYNPSFMKTIENASKENVILAKSKSKQLTSNQIVLLLQEIGFFTHPKIEDIPKTKQAELISKICGLTPKNIKSNIEKLDKTELVNGDNYQKDIDKINKILDDLT